MNSKYYVSYKAAKLLKEKGYNEATDYIIDEDDCIMNSHYLLNEDLSEYVCSCPTKAEAIDWLESKGITIEVHRNSWKGYVEWKYYILEKGHREFLYLTRLEAEEAAIIKALELL